jgi:hypothetical protein
MYSLKHEGSKYTRAQNHELQIMKNPLKRYGTVAAQGNLRDSSPQQGMDDHKRL